MNALHQPPIARCHDTGKVRIGIAHVPRTPRTLPKDAEALQEALLNPRTAKELPLHSRLLGALWKWA